MFLGLLDPFVRGTDPDHQAKIARIQILLVLALTCKTPTKNYFKKSFSAFYLLFKATFISFFKDKRSQRSHKKVGIKVFLTILA
jgi:hypothetical protein